MRYVRTDSHEPRTPSPSPSPSTRTAVSRPTEPSWSGSTLKKPTIALRQRLRGAASRRQRDQRAEQPDERALEHERPADERVRRADQPHDLDLLGPRHDGEPDRVDDDEQHDHPDDRDHHDPRGPHEARDGDHAVDEGLDVEDVADERVVVQGAS